MCRQTANSLVRILSSNQPTSGHKSEESPFEASLCSQPNELSKTFEIALICDFCAISGTFWDSLL